MTFQKAILLAILSLLLAIYCLCWVVVRLLQSSTGALGILSLILAAIGIGLTAFSLPALLRQDHKH